MNTSGPREPLSWLILERYALDELGAERRREVEARLASSAYDRARLASIRGDRVQLLPLPTEAAPRPLLAQGKLWLSAVGVLAVAAMLLMARLNKTDLSPPGTQVKGGELALVLVGERHGVDATTFSQGERFKLLVTCPPELGGTLRAAVYQGGSLFRPLADGGPQSCGNRSPWPGAFVLDGPARVIVCVRSDAGDWPSSSEQLDDAAACKALDPAD